MGEILLFAGHAEIGLTASVFGRVAAQRGPGAEVNFRGLELHFDVVVAEQVAQDAVGLAPGFAERGAVGVAQVFREQFRVLQRQRTQAFGGHAELLGGGFPGVPVGAVLGGFE